MVRHDFRKLAKAAAEAAAEKKAVNIAVLDCAQRE